MSTHGNIKVIDASSIGKDDGNFFWLHAYSDGHTDEAFEMLKTLPQFLVKRSILYHELLEYIKEENEHDDGIGVVDFLSECGTVGPWHLNTMLRVLENKDEKLTRNLLEAHWDNNFGVDLSNCCAIVIANLMVQRTFNRWHIMREQDAPWHTVDDDDDLTVVCHDDTGKLFITPSEESIAAYEDTDEPLGDSVQIDFAADVKRLFLEEFISRFPKEKLEE